jgi:hypothetical protein
MENVFRRSEPHEVESDEVDLAMVSIVIDRNNPHNVRIVTRTPDDMEVENRDWVLNYLAEHITTAGHSGDPAIARSLVKAIHDYLVMMDSMRDTCVGRC